jgi:choice-of-anchor C domain-containing protein
MKSLKSIVAASTVGTMLLLPGSAFANLVLDGGFEQGTVSGSYLQTYTTPNPMGGWAVSAGSVDLIGPLTWLASEGSQSVDMAGDFANGTIQQTITGVTPLAMYYLTFDMSGNLGGGSAIKTLSVTFGNTTMGFTFNTTGITVTNMGWAQQSGWFQASGSSSVLSFTDNSGERTAWGAVIDNVSLVPEPTTLIAGALLLLPFGASTLRRLRKSRTA